MKIRTTAPLVSWLQGRLMSMVLGSILRSGKKKLGFSIRKFSVVARSLEVDGVTPSCLGKHVKPLVPAVIRRSLTVDTYSQEPESLTTSLTMRYRVAQ